MSVSGDKRSSTKISVGQQMTINMKMEITTSAVHDGLLITTGIQANNDRNRNRSVDIGLLSPDQNPQMWNWWRKQTGNVPVAVEDSTFLPLANGRTNDEVLNPQKSMSSILPSSPERHIHSPSRLEHVETTENYFAQRKTVSENCTLDNNALSTSANSTSDFKPKTTYGHGPIRLNLFDNDTSTELIPAAAGNGFSPPKKECFLNDSTTTTTTLEVFRGKKSPTIDWYKLPAGPLTPTVPYEYVSASGPEYECVNRSTTSFSVGPNETSTPVPQKSVQFDDRVLECESDTSSYRDFKSPDYVVREPSSILSPTQPKSPSSAQFSPNSDGSLAYSTTQEPSTLIIRRQHRERSLQEILSKDQNTGAEQPPDTVPWRPTSAADDKGDQQPFTRDANHLNVQSDAVGERSRPPRPPKTGTFLPPQNSGIFKVPPRPVTRKPRGMERDPLAQRSPFVSGGRSSTLPRAHSSGPMQPNQQTLSRQQLMTHRPPQRSASVADISYLYKTRDCLGRIVREL